jgi:hypothetical protein
MNAAVRAREGDSNHARGADLANSLLMQEYSILMPIFLHPGMHQTRARATKTLNRKKGLLQIVWVEIGPNIRETSSGRGFR